MTFNSRRLLDRFSLGGDGFTWEFLKAIFFYKIILNFSLVKKTRVLSDARSLKELPSIDGCSSLEILRMDRASLSHVPSNLCLNSSHLKSL